MTKRGKEDVLRRTYKYPIYPTQEQKEKFVSILNICRELYNAAIQERKEAYERYKKTIHSGIEAEKPVINYYTQAGQLKEIRQIRLDMKELVYAQIAQDVLNRVKLAFEAFFRRVKAGETPGYPRFQGAKFYNSFTYTQSGYELKMTERKKIHILSLSKIGDVKIRLYRPIEGKIKTCQIVRDGEKWFACFSCEVGAPEPREKTGKEVGIDLGVTHFVTLSTGKAIDSPRPYKVAQAKLATKQQELARRKKGSNRWRKKVAEIRRLHRKIKNQRKDITHKTSRMLVEEYDLIVFENLNVSGMTRAPKPKQDGNGKYLPNNRGAKAALNAGMLDHAWSSLKIATAYKAETAGVQVTEVDPRGTSQECSGCGAIVKKDLSVRTHSCPECGLVLDRDHNAAINILNRGKKQMEVKQ